MPFISNRESLEGALRKTLACALGGAKKMKNIINLSVITTELSEQSEHQMMVSFAHVQSILFWNEAISHLQSGERETQFWERNYQFLSFYTLEQALAAFERAASR